MEEISRHMQTIIDCLVKHQIISKPTSKSRFSNNFTYLHKIYYDEIMFHEKFYNLDLVLDVIDFQPDYYSTIEYSIFNAVGFIQKLIQQLLDMKFDFTPKEIETFKKINKYYDKIEKIIYMSVYLHTFVSVIERNEIARFVKNRLNSEENKDHVYIKDTDIREKYYEFVPYKNMKELLEQAQDALEYVYDIVEDKDPEVINLKFPRQLSMDELKKELTDCFTKEIYDKLKAKEIEKNK